MNLVQKNLIHENRGTSVKQLIQNILFGKPVQGTKINYGEQQVKTTTPYNVDYKAWKDCVTEFGYQTFIQYLQKIKSSREAALK